MIVSGDTTYNTPAPALFPARARKPARTASGRAPGRAWLSVGGQQLAHHTHGVQQALLELRGEGHLVLNAASKDQEAIGWPGPVDLLEQQARGRDLRDARGLHARACGFCSTGIR